MNWREATAIELADERWERGRVERGLEVGAPFHWDNPEIGVDEIEELVDAFIYRRQRYREWYGPDVNQWPYVAWQRLQEATAAIDTLIAELKLGPLTGNPLVCRCRE